ncbi:helix-turn-helix domain-containing protein [Paenibacillus thalictri]|nr:helix-turn-helix domain-containing protein [Paenibacillus thalictri]
MPTILIVDDELLIRKGLLNMIRRLCPGWQIVGEAASGEEGIRAIEALTPDAVIADIRMPGMSGLEMIESALSRQGSLSFIILSGYGEFQFVQRALRIGVEDYLLKPVKSNELAAVLRKMETKLSERKSELTLKAQIQTFKEETRRSALEKAVKQLVEGNIYLGSVERDILEEEGLRFAEMQYVVMSLEIDPESLIGRAKTVKDEQLFKLFFQQIIHEIIQKHGTGAAFLGPDDAPLVVVFASGVTQPLVETAIKIGGEIEYSMKTYARLEVITGISAPQMGYEQVRIAYRQAQENANRHKNDRPVYQAMTFIQKHYREKCNLKETAAFVHLHPTYLSELFHKKTGMYFTEYINHIRILEAKRLLSETSAAVEEIVDKTGFQSYRHFNRVFREHTGYSPGEYRKRYL